LDLSVIDHSHTTIQTFGQSVFRTMEWKTAARLEPALIDGFHLDDQVVGQNYLVTREVVLEELPPYAGVTVDIVTKHAEPQLYRIVVPPNEGQIRNWMKSRRFHSAVAALSREAGYPQNGINCNRKYGACGYSELCVATSGLGLDEQVALVQRGFPGLRSRD
jgi:hypothetical protein